MLNYYVILLFSQTDLSSTKFCYRFNLLVFLIPTDEQNKSGIDHL
jgi:hypothetical protein